MKEIQPEFNQLLPTAPCIVYDRKTYEEVESLIESYKSGKKVPHIELIKHPHEDGYLISEGHKRIFAAYKAGVKPKAFLIQKQEDHYDGFAGDIPLEKYTNFLIEDLEIARREGIDRIMDFEGEFESFDAAQ
ncbi:hypothetical protein KY339_03025 [Candidatus Woesearchaeota archaeon]|nr:hypothetical protein [Candidatus Woesearchaeota archaeon]